MPLKLLHDPKEGPLRVAGFMSGSGTNLRRLLERQRKLEGEEGSSPFEVAVIFSNDARSKAPAIGADFAVPVVIRDMRAWYAKRGADRRDLKLREEFDAETVKMLAPFGAKVAAFGGYMAVATAPLLEAFIGVNVHPADLSITEGGERKYTGDRAVLMAIKAGEHSIAATTHIVESRVDMGRIMMISPPVGVNVPPDSDLNDPDVAAKVADEHQEKLKERGDWVIFPRTIEDIARGRYAEDEAGTLYYDGEPAPEGVRPG